MPVVDVLLTTTVTEFPVSNDSPAPVSRRVQLRPGLSIERLQSSCAQEIVKACSPSGFRFAPERHVGPSYAFVRSDPADSSGLLWDSDGAIMESVALSRLVRPNGAGTEYSARIALTNTGKVDRIVPGPVQGILSRGYIVQPVEVPWLTATDAEALTALLEAYHAAQLPGRVRRAFWNHEFAACTHLIDVRWTIVVTALEALIHTDRHGSTTQFKKRTAAMAEELGLSGFSEAEAATVYDLRSGLAHGDHHAVGSENTKLYVAMERLLRVALRVAIEEPSFRAAFASPESVRARWRV